MNDLIDIISDSLRLDVNLWTDLSKHPQGTRFRGALLIVLFAGLSDGIAQSVVLFLNQVKPLRFISSLFISAVIFVFGYIFYLLSIDIVARYVFGATTETHIAYSLALAYAPLILSFLTMMPYFGRAIYVYLNIYHFLALIVATAVSYSLPYNQALFAVAIGWLLLTVIKSTIGRPVLGFSRWLRKTIAGTELEKTLQDFENSLTGDSA